MVSSPEKRIFGGLFLLALVKILITFKIDTSYIRSLIASTFVFFFNHVPFYREEPPDDEFAGILQQIADDLYDEAKIDSLAGQLGILHGDIQRALMTNMRFGRVTSDGTRHMLKQWRRGVSREDERIELTKALHAAKLVNLADLYLSEGKVYFH